jgi:hypothetical protein
MVCGLCGNPINPGFTACGHCGAVLILGRIGQILVKFLWLGTVLMIVFGLWACVGVCSAFHGGLLVGLLACLLTVAMGVVVIWGGRRLIRKACPYIWVKEQHFMR